MEIYYQPALSEGLHQLSEEESKHCVRVLRHAVGDKIRVVDGNGLFINAEIIEANPKKCLFKIIDREQSAKRTFAITIAISPTKNMDRTEWFLEKAVELGVNRIIFYLSKHSERKKLNLDRLEKKAVVAMKQSQQAFLPQIIFVNSFNSCLKTIDSSDQRFIAYVDHDNPVHLMDEAIKGQSYTVLVGPEGDFSKEELSLALESGFRKVSLGKNRLRTETAGLAVCQILNLINR